MHNANNRLTNKMHANLLRIALSLLLVAAGISPLMAVSGESQTRSASAVTPLDIPSKHIVTSSKDGKLVLLLDFFPFSKQLQSKAEKEARATIVSTAKHYAELYGNTKENSSFGEVLVMVVYVKNMDEYNRPNYPGMTRHGTLMFKRASGNTFVLTEDKLNLKPAG